MERPKFIYYNDRSYQEYGEALEQYINELEFSIAENANIIEFFEDDLYDANLTIEELREKIADLQYDLKEATK